MKCRIPILFLLLIWGYSAPLLAQMPMPNAFAHNDYEHEKPLLDALEHGFNYVEADVWLIDGEIYVYHDKPEQPDPKRTLKNLYFNPLKARVEANDGRVYKGHEKPFYLMVDIKSEAVATYKVLLDQVLKYKDLFLTVVYGSMPNRNPIHVFLSGNRPMDEVFKGPVAWMGLDGRPEDLGKKFPSEHMPVVSDNYWKYSNWRGEGDMPEADKKKIGQLVIDVQYERKKLRLWAHPDNEKVWRQLLELEVDLINTDRLGEFSSYAKSRILNSFK